MNDEHYIRLAIAQAAQAEALGEVPIGALIVVKDEIIAAAHNRTITDHDPAAHAEILALRTAEGIDEADFYRTFGVSIDAVYSTVITQQIKRNLLCRAQGHIALTAAGMKLGNEVFAAFLQEK